MNVLYDLIEFLLIVNLTFFLFFRIAIYLRCFWVDVRLQEKSLSKLIQEIPNYNFEEFFLNKVIALKEYEFLKENYKWSEYITFNNKIKVIRTFIL